MDGRAIDHVNVKIPEDRVGDAVAFYRDGLGFKPEQLEAYRNGDRTLFSFRISETAVLHVRPVDPDEFTEPDGSNYDHFAIVLDEDIDTILETLDEASIEVRRTSNPLGATGRNPAAYVADPFGFVIELKAGAM